MNIKKIQIGDKKVMPFTIPSGIIMTQPRCAKKLLEEIPEIGIWTTKSITPNGKKGNKEPIITQYYLGCFGNAVGLTNPGADEFAKELDETNIPEDRFILASIAGSTLEEFVEVTKTLEDKVDGFELNFSCPHAEGHGMAIGTDLRLVYEITKAVTKETRKPVIAKLTPNTNQIGVIAKAAIEAGAYGISAINTVGPGDYEFDGHRILTNGVGGMSGSGIRPLGIRCIRDIRNAIGLKPLVIGMGGIANARDVEAYKNAGANVFGVGSALAGMNDNELQKYFSALKNDLETGTNYAEGLSKEVDMEFRKVIITGKQDLAEDFKILETDYHIDARPGQFVFAWIPGIGEKPFSVMNDRPLSLGIQTKGDFTRAINSLEKGDSFYIRGPYGKQVKNLWGWDVTLVGGGCGIAGIYLMAKEFSRNGGNKVTALLGARDKNHIPYLNRIKDFGKVYVATEDGSAGIKGRVTDLFENIPAGYFFNCGPQAMIDAVLPLELRNNTPERIFSSYDEITSCGVGLCGKCADKNGARICVNGPFMNY